jgi:hypothetical protein
MIHTCPITDLTLHRKCNVSDCLYHSKISRTGCAATDAEDLSLEELQAHKGIGGGVSVICVLRKRAVGRIHHVLIVGEFLQWLEEKHKPTEYPYVTGYHDVKLQQAVHDMCAGNWMLNVTELNWNIGKVCCALQGSYWRQFERERKIAKIDHLATLGIKAAAAQRMMYTFATAALKQG